MVDGAIDRFKGGSWRVRGGGGTPSVTEEAKGALLRFSLWRAGGAENSVTPTCFLSKEVDELQGGGGRGLGDADVFPLERDLRPPPPLPPEPAASIWYVNAANFFDGKQRG